jgi:hypothetical protein
MGGRGTLESYPIIPAIWEAEQDDFEFEARLGKVRKPLLQNQKWVQSQAPQNNRNGIDCAPHQQERVCVVITTFSQNNTL